MILPGPEGVKERFGRFFWIMEEILCIKKIDIG
jgi:hypothetical protein